MFIDKCGAFGIFDRNSIVLSADRGDMNGLCRDEVEKFRFVRTCGVFEKFNPWTWE